MESEIAVKRPLLVDKSRMPLAMGVAFVAFTTQFGLMAVVKKGYAYLGYASLITVFIPFVIHAIATKMKDI